MPGDECGVPLCDGVLDGDSAGLSKLVGQGSLVSGDEFVAGSEDREVGQFGDSERDCANRGRDAQVSRAQCDSGFKNEISGLGSFQRDTFAPQLFGRTEDEPVCFRRESSKP